MKREIKFRGKRIDNGEWVYGHYATSKILLLEEIDHIIIVDGYTAVSVDPETVGQYTGQADFYAGDIAKSPRGSIGIIAWHDSWCGFYFKTILSPNEDGVLTRAWQSVPLWNDLPSCLKLGNRWDNPDLLEG